MPVRCPTCRDIFILGKWNLLYTPYCFDGGYGNELTWKQVKIMVFFGVLAVNDCVVVLRI